MPGGKRSRARDGGFARFGAQGSFLSRPNFDYSNELEVVLRKSPLRRTAQSAYLRSAIEYAKSLYHKPRTLVFRPLVLL